MNTKSKIAWIVLLLGSVSMAANADVLYSHNYDNDPVVANMNGAAPDVAPGSEVFVGGGGVSNAGVGSGHQVSHLAYQFTSGNVYTYTLSGNYSYDGNSDTPIYIAFTGDATSIGNFFADGDNVGQVNIYRDGSYDVWDGATNGVVAYTRTAQDVLFSSAGFNTYVAQLILDTTSSDWTLGLKGGASVGTLADLDASNSASTVHTLSATSKSFLQQSTAGIGFRLGSSSGTTINSLELAVVPEPSSFMMMVAGLIAGAVLLRRRK